MHQALGHSKPPATPVAASSASHSAVSRSAGPSLRRISSFIRLRATSGWYHSAATSPIRSASSALGPINE